MNYKEIDEKINKIKGTYNKSSNEFYAKFLIKHKNDAIFREELFKYRLSIEELEFYLKKKKEKKVKSLKEINKQIMYERYEYGKKKL